MGKISIRTLQPRTATNGHMPRMRLEPVKLARRKPYRLTVNGQETYHTRIEYIDAQGEIHGPLALVWTPYQHNPQSGYIDLIHVKSGYSLAMIGYGIRCARKVADELGNLPPVVWEFDGPDSLAPDVLSALRATVAEAIQRHVK